MDECKALLQQMVDELIAIKVAQNNVLLELQKITTEFIGGE
jgi:hypothetical protein